MTIKGRVQEYTNAGTNLKAIQILEHPYRDSLTINVLGFLTFQEFTSRKGTFNFTGVDISTDNEKHIFKMAKIVKEINDNTNFENNTFEIVSALLNLEEYVIFKNDFIALKDNNKRLYSVYTDGGKLYKYIIAINDMQAEKQIDKLKLDNSTYTSILIKVKSNS